MLSLDSLARLESMQRDGVMVTLRWDASLGWTVAWMLHTGVRYSSLAETLDAAIEGVYRRATEEG